MGCLDSSGSRTGHEALVVVSRRWKPQQGSDDTEWLGGPGAAEGGEWTGLDGRRMRGAALPQVIWWMEVPFLGSQAMGRGPGWSRNPCSASDVLCLSHRGGDGREMVGQVGWELRYAAWVN